jgi:ribonuclease-3 family protein
MPARPADASTAAAPPTPPAPPIQPSGLRLDRRWPPAQAARLPARTLAYIGDAVFELGMRLSHLDSGLDKMGRLHSSVVSLVNADHQAKLFEAIYPTLAEPEQTLLRTWRNAKMPARHSGTSRGVYARATAFEAWLGYLFLTGQTERFEALLAQALSSGVARPGTEPPGPPPARHRPS